VTLEELKIKYPFTKNMEKGDIKKLVMFILMFLMKINFGEREEAEEIIKDLSSIT
jgi:hypothetical protein